MFDASHFTIWNLAYTAIGAVTYWGIKGRMTLKVYALTDLVNLLKIEYKYRRAIQLLIFVALGCFVGIGVVEPENPRQAITAGFAWISIFSTQVTQKVVR
jgi:hypothetical protein